MLTTQLAGISCRKTQKDVIDKSNIVSYIY